MYSIEDEDVLVTGGAGFIGSTLVRQLVDAGNNVTVIDNLSSGSVSNLEDAVGTESFPDTVDVLDEDLMEVDVGDILQSKNIDYVFHLAAEPFVPDGYSNPMDVLRVNVTGTLKTLLACRDSGITRFLHYSSSEVYGRTPSDPIDEDAPVRPCSSYGVTKLAADRLCSTVRAEHGVPTTVIRQFNTYGPRETHPRVIPEIISQISRQDTLSLGNMDARRDFTYVEDAASAAIQLAACPRTEGEVVNVGTGESFSVRQIADLIADIMDAHIEVQEESSKLRPKDIPKLECDCSKAAELIGYEPETSFEGGLAKTITWYRENSGWSWD